MRKGILAVKMNRELLRELREFCEDKGFKQSSFVEFALREKMKQEELKEDIFDLVSLKSQEKLAIPFREYHRRRNRK